MRVLKRHVVSTRFETRKTSVSRSTSVSSEAAFLAPSEHEIKRDDNQKDKSSYCEIIEIRRRHLWRVLGVPD